MDDDEREEAIAHIISILLGIVACVIGISTILLGS